MHVECFGKPNLELRAGTETSGAYEKRNDFEHSVSDEASPECERDNFGSWVSFRR
jgi:hypothetical protein